MFMHSYIMGAIGVDSHSTKSSSSVCQWPSLNGPLLLFFSIINVCLLAETVAQEVCPIDPKVVGFATLDALAKAMKQDFLDAMSGPLNLPPHIYRLCPKTTFPIYDSSADSALPGYIYPVLDGTQIICGNDGKSENGCVIYGGDAQVILRESVVEEYVRRNAEFRGITFVQSRRLSIAAWDRSGTRVSFVDCHWKKNTGMAVMQNIYVPLPSRIQETDYHVNSDFTMNKNNPKRGRRATSTKLDQRNYEVTKFENSIERGDSKSRVNLYEAMGLDGNHFSYKGYNDYGTKNIRGLESVEGGMEIHMIRCTISESYPNKEQEFFNIINVRGILNIQNCDFNKNQGTFGLVSIAGVNVLDRAKFRSGTFDHTISSHDGTMIITNSKFEGNNVTTDIITSDDDNDGIGGTSLTLTQSCFLNGEYQLAPVFLRANTTLHENTGNHISVETDSNCIIFAEGFNSQCLNDIEDLPCHGTCEAFDAAYCSTYPPTLTPTENPSASPSDSLFPTISPMPFLSSSHTPTLTNTAHPSEENSAVFAIENEGRGEANTTSGTGTLEIVVGVAGVAICGLALFVSIITCRKVRHQRFLNRTQQQIFA